jgi:hypothetical protein
MIESMDESVVEIPKFRASWTSVLTNYWRWCPPQVPTVTVASMRRNERCGHLPDGSVKYAGCDEAMLMGWHLTGERKYLDALLKAGKWVITAQLPGVACGWAEQYSDDDYLGLIEPERDWYKTPLLQAEGSRNGAASAEQNSRNE